MKTYKGAVHFTYEIALFFLFSLNANLLLTPSFLPIFSL